jgi:hypothetical protein
VTPESHPTFFYKKERNTNMAELNETAEAKQRLQKLKEKMLTLKEHL